MNGVEALIEKFRRGELLHPLCDVPNLVDFSRALAALLGVNGINRTPGMEKVSTMLGSFEHVGFVMVDGLGVDLLEHLQRDSFLRAHLVSNLTTVFPSSTAPALTSVATGEWPAKHAITGWWTHLPEIGAASTILAFTNRSGSQSLRDYGITAAKAFPIPSLLSQIAWDVVAYLPQQIASSVYSVYFSGAAARRGYVSFYEAGTWSAERVTHAAAPTCTYVYVSELDSVAHSRGVWSDEVAAVMRRLDQGLEELARKLGTRARLIVTADHGFLDAPPEARHEILPYDPLLRMLEFTPSGDARVLYFHVARDAEHTFRRAFTERFGDRFLLLSVGEAQEQRLFGPEPLSSLAVARLGNLMAISLGADVVECRLEGGQGHLLTAASHHSGLTPQEMLVPLIIV
jgi:hypothetical protein